MTETQTGKQSRNGKKPVEIAKGVQVSISGQDVTIKGPKGELTHTARPEVVVTQDEGAQPLRWIGQRTVEATGDFAPIRIAAGTFGNHRELLVSPLHRVLIRDSLAENSRMVAMIIRAGNILSDSLTESFGAT